MSLELWESCLKKLFDLPASVILITGLWKTGKTDFALLLYEELRRLGIIGKGASNIETKASDMLCIQSMPLLKRWIFGDTISKLFIYDEAIKGTPKRRAMGNLNVAWLQDIIPELSKGRAKLIVVTQEIDLTESVFYHPTFCRGVFRKISKRIVVVRSKLLDGEYSFRDIPRTRIDFDPFHQAPFNLVESLEDQKPLMDFDSLEDDMKIALWYSEGVPMSQIGLKFKPPLHRYAVARLLQKALGKLDPSLKVAVLYGEGFSTGKIGERFDPPLHQQQVVRLLRKFLKDARESLVTSHKLSERDRATP